MKVGWSVEYKCTQCHKSSCLPQGPIWSAGSTSPFSPVEQPSCTPVMDSLGHIHLERPPPSSLASSLLSPLCSSLSLGPSPAPPNTTVWVGDPAALPGGEHRLQHLRLLIVPWAGGYTLAKSYSLQKPPLCHCPLTLS